MTGAFDGPLEARPNPSGWTALFDLALPVLDHAMPNEQDRLARGDAPRWSLGGGTALALRLGHRVSDDIDIFIEGVRLAELSPGRNPAARAIDDKPDWPGHYLKFHRPEGEIDFLGVLLQTIPGFTLEAYRGRAVALETAEEVMVKKLRFRSASFTLRDAFDLACVLKARPETVLTLAAEVGDAVPRVRLALGSLSEDKARPAIRASPAFADVLQRPVALARSSLDDIAYFRDNRISERTAGHIASAVATVEWFRPGTEHGNVNFGWNDPSYSLEGEQCGAMYAHPVEFKAALLDAWRKQDPKAFAQWDGAGRPAGRHRAFVVDRSRNAPER